MDQNKKMWSFIALTLALAIGGLGMSMITFFYKVVVPESLIVEEGDRDKRVYPYNR